MKEEKITQIKPKLVLLMLLLSKGSSAARALYWHLTLQRASIRRRFHMAYHRLKKTKWHFLIIALDTKAACFSLGGYLKRENSWTLLECEIDCCTGKNCNMQIPTGSPSANAIKVFATAGKKNWEGCSIFQLSNKRKKEVEVNTECIHFSKAFHSP